ncbi:hypothetical protein HY605_03015 [Candidatus Peregrinibacteria bacterium]|nr:hypothetical protein [Candidatus Peregrinibacteria bacterium]
MPQAAINYEVAVLETTEEMEAIIPEIDSSFGDHAPLTRWEIAYRNNAFKVIHTLRDDTNRLVALSVLSIDIEKQRAEIAWRIVKISSQGLGLINLLHAKELAYLKTLGIRKISAVAATTNGEKSFRKQGFTTLDQMNPDHVTLELDA